MSNFLEYHRYGCIKFTSCLDNYKNIIIFYKYLDVLINFLSVIYFIIILVYSNT